MKINKCGFTLIELLIYISIFAIAAGLLSGILVIFTRIQGQEAASSEVTQQLSFVQTTIQRLVRESVNIQNRAGPAYASSSLTLRMASSSLDPTVISSDSNAIYLQQGTGSINLLTSDRVKVSQFQVVKYENPGGHAIVQVDISLSYNSQRVYQQITRNLKTSIGRVTAASFDDNLLPNQDNMFSLGIQPNNRWRTLSLSNLLYLGNLTADPAGQNGAIYYNSSSSVFRGYKAGSWQNLGEGFWTASGNNISNINSGNVGIGTTGPGTLLSLAKGSASDVALLELNQPTTLGNQQKSSIIFTDTTGGTAQTVAAIGMRYVNALDTGALDFHGFYNAGTHNSVSVMTLLGSGNVGIGTTGPAYKLDVRNTTPATITVYGKMTATSGTGHWAAQFENQSTAGISYGIGGFALGAGTTNIAGYFSASGATNNYGLIVNAGNVGIGTTEPGAKLEVAGQIKITGGTPGASKVLTSDASGLASWQTLAPGAEEVLNKVTDMPPQNINHQTTCALMTDKTVKCWGYNGHCELGIGTDTNYRYLPVEVPLPSSVKSIAEAFYAYYALLENGQVWAWGYNGHGQVGNGSTADACIPVRTGSLTDVTKIVTTNSHDAASSAYALKSDGTVWSWGYNGYGQLGVGDTTQRNSPVQVAGLTNVVDIDASDGQYASACALKSDATLWCWGYNGYGQLGVGDTTQRTTPVQVLGLTNVVQIASTGTGSIGHKCALKSDWTVWCWGYNAYGQLGDNSITQRNSPVQVFGLTDVKSIYLGGGWYGSSYAILNNNTVKVWGYNGYGQLGVGDTTQRTTPVALGLSNVKQIIMGGTGSYGTACAVINDGNVKCWGYNGYGQVGDGGTNQRNSPVDIAMGFFKNANKIWAKGYSNIEYFCILLNDGRLKCWGYNGNGQIGIGSTINVRIPNFVYDVND